MYSMRNKRLLCALLTGVALGVQAQTHEFVVQTQKLGTEIPSTMYGIFFEDINFAADGGLYAELVKNRSFEFPEAFCGWKTFGEVKLMDGGPFERNPHYVRLSPANHSQKQTGLDNEGFFGIGVQKDKEYRFSVWARLPQGGEPVKLRVELVNTASMGETQAFATQEVQVTSQEWKKYQVRLKPEETQAKSRLRIILASQGTVDLEHVSLFPVDTWMGHENGMRRDLAQALADLKPGVFRFPGGCIVEGTDLKSRYQWKNSVGPVENRPLNESRWKDAFPYRLYPDYYQSYGLGFYEFFLLSEEIGAEPLPVLSCGLACQFQNTDMSAHQPVDSLDSYIQDALDLIEFANGGTDTPWGKVRAEMGHPAPFGLKYLGIGNEQWGQEYVERLRPFVEVLRKRHPEIQLVGSSGPYASGEDFDYLWGEMRRLGMDLVDEHYYQNEAFFLSQASRYDAYDRRGPKVFAGEYACHGVGRKWNHFHASLLEAAYMTGLERNADVVRMATYAPLFAHIEGWQWRPDMIWYDNLRSVRTVSYYVQWLYSNYRGTNVLPLTMEGRPVTGADGQDGLFASAVYDQGQDAVIVKVANTSDQGQRIDLRFRGMRRNERLTSGRCIRLSASDLYEDNTLDCPRKVVPVEEEMSVCGQSVQVEIAPNTFMIYILKKK